MWNVTLSTMWGLGRFADLDQFFLAGARLGFRGFELNHQVDSPMLHSLELDGHRVKGVHAPCPADIPPATVRARNWLVTSLDEDGRRQGVVAIQRSIDLAHSLGAKLVVVHAGRVDVDANLEARLWALYENGQAETAEYEALIEYLIAARAEQAPANLESAGQSIAELAEYASRAGIRLGLENRYHYLDLPLPDEMEYLLDIAGDERVGFLYDVGHAQALENLGFVPHEEWLQRFAERMMAMHLHDIHGLQDHVAPGLGEVDWDMVARYLPQDAMRTLEVRSYHDPDQLRTALEFLAAKGCLERPATE
jgi:sugar phosphate isomerase/epimerase